LNNSNAKLNLTKPQKESGAEMKDKVQIERVDNFGDTRKITYNVERRQFEGVGG